jgi:S-adenosylmethionine:diacylglycerol 3-amino-3-carboxypropyl transferase
MRLCRSVDTVSVRDNYYLEYILTGDLTGRNGLPAYLCSQNFSTIRDRVDRVELVEGYVRYLFPAMSNLNAIL